MNNEQNKTVLQFDAYIFFAVIGLLTLGILFIYSSGVNSSGVLITDEYLKQLFWAVISIILIITFSFISNNLLKDLSLWIYILLLALLLLTLFVGKVVNGARAWIGIFGLGGQPSEFAKIATILFLAKFLFENKSNIKKLTVFLQALAIIAIPMALILKQPDTGTTLVFIPLLLAMYFIAGGKKRYVLFVLLTGFIGVVLALYPSIEAKIIKENLGIAAFLVNPLMVLITSGVFFAIAGVAFWGWRKFKTNTFMWILFVSLILLFSVLISYGFRMVLKEYQIMRFIVFMDPSVDPKGSGWNLIQSMTAIGSGGFPGKGFLMGTQSHYRFLPMQSTDFIFSILGEELGFIGTLLIFTLFLVIILRMIFIMYGLKDIYGTLVISGFIAMFATHFFVSIGMTAGIMPVTGIPLYFLSYGGSSLLSGGIAIGITMNIYNRRFMF